MYGGTLIALMRSKLGQPYDLHMQIPIQNFAWFGPWNCSTLIAWALWWSGDRSLLGTRFYAPSGNHPTLPYWDFPRWVYPLGLPQTYSWTEWFYRDLEKRGIRISEHAARDTAGAICLYRPHELGHSVGHIAVSLGHKKVIEAHGVADKSKSGVVESRWQDGRFAHWYKLPYFTY
jgi:hypothetical protein